MKKLKVAILGATSHIAKSLIVNFLDSNKHHLILYTRNQKKLSKFIASTNISDNGSFSIYNKYNNFIGTKCDVIINCIGVGTLSKHKGNFLKYFTITERYDNMVIEYLNNHSDVIYICLGSGAIYGNQYPSPVNKKSINEIQVNHITPQDYYSISRLYSETKHRAHKDLKIIDIRIFSYFSRFFDLTDGYFISELISSILKKKVFLTSKTNFVRDYLHPKDLYTSIISIIEHIKSNHINTALDISSLKPITKKEIIQFFATEYNLDYEFSDNFHGTSATGQKLHYYSSNMQTEQIISYKPEFSSLDTLSMEFKKFLEFINSKKSAGKDCIYASRKQTEIK